MAPEILRVLVAGSRSFDAIPVIELALEKLEQEHPKALFVLLHTGSRGADQIAASLARRKGWILEEYAARWVAIDGQPNGNAASERNEQMVGAGANIALIFYSTKAANVGTREIALLAQRAGIPLREHWDSY